MHIPRRLLRPLLLASILIPLLVIDAPGAAIHAADGDLDSGFGIGGKVTTEFGTKASAHAAAIRPDGKIVVAGIDDAGNVLLARYTANGTLDSTFGIGGKAVTPMQAIRGPASEGPGMALQPDGKIVVGAHTLATDVFGDTYVTFGLVRYLSEGSIDSSFGSSGKVTTFLERGEALVTAVLLQPDGKIVAVGRSTSFLSGCTRVAVVRYIANGEPDPTFGPQGGGLATPSLGIPYGVGCSPDGGRAAILQPDGKILITGGNAALAMIRLTANGSMDTSFGINGSVISDFVPPYNVLAYAIALQSDGKIILAGMNDYRFRLVRYLPNGQVDGSFGTDGGVFTSFPGCGPCYNRARAVAVQPDGKILMTGIETGANFPLVRYNADGTLDATFGSGGRATVGFSETAAASALLLQPDGKAVVVGSSGGLYGNGGDPGRDATGVFSLARLQGGAVATKLAFVQPLPPTSTTVGQTFGLAVQVQDANDKPVTSDNATVVTLSKGTTSTGTGNLTCTGGVGPNQQKVNAGIATFAGCMLDRPGSYLIRATSGALTASKSDAIVVFGVNVAVRTTGRFVSTRVQDNAFLPLAIQVTSLADGSPVRGASIRLQDTAQLGVTDSNGNLRTTLVLPTVPSIDDVSSQAIATVEGQDYSSGPVVLYRVRALSLTPPHIVTPDEAKHYKRALLDPYTNPFNVIPPCPDGFAICPVTKIVTLFIRVAARNLTYTPQAGDSGVVAVYEFTAPGVTTTYLYTEDYKRNGSSIYSRAKWTEDKSLVQPVLDAVALDGTAIVVTVASPITLLVIDPLGRRAGFDSVAGRFVDDFPVVISRVGDEPYHLIIPSPLPGNYKLQAVGTDNGTYTMSVLGLDASGNASSSVSVSGATARDLTDFYVIGYSPVPGVAITLQRANVVNDALILGRLGTAYNPADTRAPAGVFTISASWTNVGGVPLSNLFLLTRTLTGGNTVLNRDPGSPPDVGAMVSVPPSALGPDGTLAPDASFTQTFEIGLQQAASFDFFVDAYGVAAVPAGPAVANRGAVREPGGWSTQPFGGGFSPGGKPAPTPTPKPCTTRGGCETPPPTPCPRGGCAVPSPTPAAPPLRQPKPGR